MAVAQDAAASDEDATFGEELQMMEELIESLPA